MTGKHRILIILLLLSAHTLSAQTDSVKYNKDFVFKDGIYVTIEDLKNNKPNLTPDNFKQYNPEIGYLDENFFENKGFFKHKRKVFYPDSIGNVKERRIDSLFCYVAKNYIFLIRPTDMGFAVLRIFKLGAISHCFEVNKKPQDLASAGPNINIGPGGPTVDVRARTNPPRGKERQYIFNFTTQKIYDYDATYFEKQLKKIDNDLYNEFSKFSSSKKKNMIFIYLNKVNEKHPIYFKN